MKQLKSVFFLLFALQSAGVFAAKPTVYEPSKTTKILLDSIVKMIPNRKTGNFWRDVGNFVTQLDDGRPVLTKGPAGDFIGPFPFYDSVESPDLLAGKVEAIVNLLNKGETVKTKSIRNHNVALRKVGGFLDTMYKQLTKLDQQDAQEAVGYLRAAMDGIEVSFQENRIEQGTTTIDAKSMSKSAIDNMKRFLPAGKRLASNIESSVEEPITAVFNRYLKD